MSKQVGYFFSDFVAFSQCLNFITGESVPVTKTPISQFEDEIYNDRYHQKHTLLCGTEVIQTRSTSQNNHVLAVVIRTGNY